MYKNLDNALLRGVMVLFTACSIFACGGAPITITENDHNVFPIRKTENANHVWYAVKTDGKCDIVDVFAYWQMDAEDGHTEELLSIEEPYYGIDDVQISGNAAWFKLAKLPEKRIKVVVESKEDEEGNITCSFPGLGQIDGQEAILNEIWLHNEGTTVHSIDVIGWLYTDRDVEIVETIIP